MTPYDVARFWAKCKILPGEDACWEWQAGRFSGKDYGQFKLDGKPCYAHRIAWMIVHGSEPPNNQNVLHRCDNPPCVNPEHLFIGTQLDNVLDAEAKGRRDGLHRSKRGELSNFAKITEADVREIRLMAAKGFRQQAIADKFGISRPAISLIVTRKNWANVP